MTGKGGADHTKGEIKLVRGSGPPITTVEGEAVQIEQTVYLLGGNVWSPSLPRRAEVIGIDLTRRVVRLRLHDGKEALYTALKDGDREDYWIFSTQENARHNAIRICESAVKYAETQADEAIQKLESAKERLSKAKSWSGAS